ncbi:hypothetical protein DENSPDRAFT_365059 [Dentipellis sp. KUC8613]|nr:hypothetical protein DENSPDRAFT_365059 [Dentipellis sp. KUC8613]
MTEPKAFLLVFSEPGPDVSESEFHDWYNNEHVPLRVNTPAFSSWARWEQADGAKPTWAATYDIDSYESTQVAPYTTLAETRSEREKSVISRLQLLDRRTFEIHNIQPPTPPSSLYDPKKTPPFVVIVSTEVKPEGEEEFNKWYDEEHVPLLAAVPGWIRSRRFVLKDSGSLGKEGPKRVPKYLAVHEWNSLDGQGGEKFKAIFTPWRTKVVETIVTSQERRVFKLYKSWEREN